MPRKSTQQTLPPLEWLRTFESAARLGNFTRAASELGLTQAGVSQQIRNLEAYLETSLFTRLARGVQLTVEGEAYAPHVRSSLFALRRSTSDLFSLSRQLVTIAAPASVIAHWIVPRLPELSDANPGLELSLVTVHHSSDLSASNSDFEVRFGDGTWPDRQSRKLFDEILAPVASASLIGEVGESWRDLPQIAVSGPRYGWFDWADTAGVAAPPPPSIRFDTFTQAAAAAVTGLGVLLGSLGLLKQELGSGALVRLPEPIARMPNGYWLTWRETGRTYSDHASILQVLCDHD